MARRMQTMVIERPEGRGKDRKCPSRSSTSTVSSAANEPGDDPSDALVEAMSDHWSAWDGMAEMAAEARGRS